jgi:hypothetical protein
MTNSNWMNHNEVPVLVGLLTGLVPLAADVHGGSSESVAPDGAVVESALQVHLIYSYMSNTAPY